VEARLRELRDVADEFDDRVLVGEVYMDPVKLVRYYGEAGRGAHLPFNFGLVGVRWDARPVRAAIAAYEAALPAGGWPSWVLGNHDQARVATRLGPAQARVAAMLLLTLRGTPTIYQGDELGLPDATVPPGRVVDVAGRDPQRSPMPWTTAGPAAGFSDAAPWLPMVSDAGARSVEAQRDDPSSVLTLHRRLLALRRASAALNAGAWEPVEAPEGIVAFDRVHGAERLRVILNITQHSIEVPLMPTGTSWVEVLCAAAPAGGRPLRGSLRLEGDQGVIVRPG
jgi:alpha-glucosidase